MRLIDIEAEVCADCVCRDKCDRQAYCWAKEMQTVDAVPVVRCRECKQGEVDDPDFPDQYYCHAGCGWNNGDFYCSYGERKEGSDNG